MAHISQFAGALAVLCVLVSVIQSCNVGSDCGAQECCVLDKSTGSGKCSPMGDLTAHCFVKQGYAWSRPEAMVTDFEICPCRTGYLCGPIQQTDPVYGQKGICTFG